MQVKSNIDFENIIRMSEIAEIYETTRQHEKSVRYHKNIVKLCNRHPKCEEILIFKKKSLKYLKKAHKSSATDFKTGFCNSKPYNISGHVTGD